MVTICHGQGVSQKCFNTLYFSEKLTPCPPYSCNIGARPALIELESVDRLYAKKGTPVVALRDVSVRFNAGEFVCITGPSGAGKSTLMHTIGCLDTPDSGSYRFAGREVQSLDVDALALLRRRAFGFIFQNYNLLEAATARENVELPAVYAGLAPQARRARALELLAKLGLERRVNHRPAALSGGEQQRVAIARALMNGGRVILADEPTGSLDGKSGEEALRLLERLAEEGHAVILISHNPEVAARAQRRVAMLDGRIVEDIGASAQPPGAAALAQGGNAQGGVAINGPGRLLDDLRTGGASLRANLLRVGGIRAALATFSILLGVWLVVTMLSIAAGVYGDTLSTVGRLGTNHMQVHPSFRDGEQPARLTLTDARAIADSVPNIERVLPILEQTLTARFGDKSLPVSVQSYIEIAADDSGTSAPLMERGRFITPRNNGNLDQIAVIGWGVQDDLFPEETDPVGQYVMLGNLPFLVQGVLASRQHYSAVPPFLARLQGQFIVVPYRTAAALLFGTDTPQSLDIIVRDPLKMEAAEKNVRALLIRQQAGEGFLIGYSGSRVEQTGRIRVRLWLGLGVIGGIALLAGGLGVMVIMLMAVGERTREIGIRMAVGARRRDITKQFTIEALALSVAGGALGLLVSLATNPALRSFGIPMAFSPWIVLTALVCSVGTGLAFGVAPARRASRLDPVAALAARG